MKNRIYTTASAVTALSIAERGLGFLYRIVLSRLLGAEGLGLYQVALSVFALFLTLGTGGIPITVSRMISKSKAENDKRAEKNTVSAGLCLSLLLTLPFCILFLLFGSNMRFLFSDERCIEIFKILLLGLVFSALYAVIRGSFWGNKQLLLPSVLEIAEESVMVIAGVLLLQNVTSPLSGAKKAAWAVVISYLFSFTASTLCFFFKGGRLSHPKKQLKPLFNATLPITSVRASSSLVNSAIAVLLPVMLIRSGISESEALKLFGIVSGMAIPVLSIPSTIIGSISLVLIPELSEDFYRKNYERLRKNINYGLKATLFVACILIPFFYALGDELGNIAFANKTAGELIQKGSLLLLPMSLTIISTGLLNSLGFEKQTFLYYFISAAALLICILFLPPLCGIYAYVIGLFASYTLNAALNLLYLHKKCPKSKKRVEQVRVQDVFLPILFMLPLAITGELCDALFEPIFGEFTGVLVTALLLAVFTFLLYVLFRLLPVKNIFSTKKHRVVEK